MDLSVLGTYLLQYQQRIGGHDAAAVANTATSANPGATLPPGEGAHAGDLSVPGGSGSSSSSAVAAITAVNGSADARVCRPSFFFFTTGELDDLVKALMGLSQLPDAPATTAAASASASAAKGGGGAGGGGGSGGGGLGLKLTFSLAVLAIGLSDAASSLDARRRVRL